MFLTSAFFLFFLKICDRSRNMQKLMVIFVCVFLCGCTQFVRVRKGDTLYSISRTHEVPVRALIQENKIPEPYIIKIGQRLKIPQQRTYTVRRGDTLYSIARKFDLSVNQVARQNKIQPPYTLKPGQKLILQSWDDMGGATTTLNQKGSNQKSSAKSAKKAVKLPANAKNKRFNKPVQGKVIQKFGMTSNGTYNDGINISAKAGTPILAAEKGTVAYAGSDLKGYGNLVLVRHDGGWFTAYAHADKIHVKKGDIVKLNQKIATVGKTGGVKQPQLHFEVRYKSKPVDPSMYLR